MEPRAGLVAEVHLEFSTKGGGGKTTVEEFRGGGGGEASPCTPASSVDYLLRATTLINGHKAQ